MPTPLRREPVVAAGEPITHTPAIGFRRSRAEDETGAIPFGRRLRDVRLESGLSQKQLARSSTLSVRAIRDLENGRVRQPRADSLRLLADALGLSTLQMNRMANDHSPSSAPGAAEPTVGGPLIGRGREVEALTTMLGVGQHRLVTVTGIEGVGKTRLAREAARTLEATEHLAVFWLSLDDDQIRSAGVSAGAPEQPPWLSGTVRSGPEERRRLAETIGESNGLLVLDGAEPEDEPADITAGLLAACPRLRILVTTRNPVDTCLDTVFPLAPLPVPWPDADPADLDEVASVTLLLGQMRRIQPSFSPDPQVLADVARICRALDGLPAALESVAHWSLIYSVRQLAHQLTTEPLAVARPPRTRRRTDAYASVRDTIAALGSRQRDLLSVMCHRPPREADRHWSLPEVADAMGMTVTECADDIYHLLLLGILRRIDRRDTVMFRALNIVNFVSMAGQRAAA